MYFSYLIISAYVITPDGRIDYTTHKQIWWDKESFNTTYNNTTVFNNAATGYLALYSLQ